MKTRNLVWWMIVLALLAGCNGYEDGPAISLRSRPGRMQFERPITNYQVGGVDSLIGLQSIFRDSLAEYTGVFRFEYEPNQIENRISWGGATNRSSGIWINENSYKTLTIALPYQPFEPCCWNVLRLSSKDLWLEKTTAGITRELRFEE